MKNRRWTIVIALCVVLLCITVRYCVVRERRVQVFTGYVMGNMRGSNAIQQRIKRDSYLKHIAPFTRLIFDDEYDIEVCEVIGDWHRPIRQFRVSREDYKRCIPPTKVVVRYYERDHDIVVLSVEQYNE